MNRNSFILSLMLTGAAVCPGVARAAVVLDDYSTNKSSQYVSYLWNSSPAMTFAITNGALAPTGHGGWVGSGFYWNGGQTLKPGEGVSAIIQVDSLGVSGASSYTGLCLSTSTATQNPYRFMAVEGYGWFMHTEGGTFPQVDTAVDGSGMPTWDKRSLLTLTRGTGANQAVITWLFSKIDGFGLSGTGAVTIPGLTASTPLYFGTAAVSPNAAPQPTWDDLTYIPEPGMLALLALGSLGVLRRRRS